MNPPMGGNGSNYYRRYPFYQLQADPHGINSTPYGGFGGISVPPPNEWRGPSVPPPSEWRGPSIPPPSEWGGGRGSGPSIPPPSEWGRGLPRGLPNIPPPNEWGRGLPDVPPPNEWGRGLPNIPPPNEWGRGLPDVPPPNEWGRGLPDVPPPSEWGRGLPDVPPVSEWGRGLPDVPPVSEWDAEVPDWLKNRTRVLPDNIGNPCVPTADMTYKDFPFYGEVMVPEYRVVRCNTVVGYCGSMRTSYFQPKVRICYSRSLDTREIYKVIIERVEACLKSALNSATQRFALTLGVSEVLLGTTLPLAIQDAYNVFQDEFLKCLSRSPDTANVKDYIQFSVFAERTARSTDWSR